MHSCIITVMYFSFSSGERFQIVRKTAQKILFNKIQTKILKMCLSLEPFFS